VQGVGGIADLALAAQEHEDVARALAQQLGDRVADRVDLVGDRLVVRAVADLHRVRAAGDLDDGSAAEVAAEALGIDRRRRDHELEVGAAREQAGQEAQEEVDVEAALVRLVDDDRVVAAQEPVAPDVGEEQAVGQHADEGVLRRAVVEAHGVAHDGPERDAELLGDALGDRARGHASRLRVRDRAADAAAELEAQLRQLRRLAGARLAGHDDDLVVADRREQVVPARADRQLGRIGDRRHGRPARRRARLRRQIGLGHVQAAARGRARARPAGTRRATSTSTRATATGTVIGRVSVT
jgi:hypothetical protein